MALLSFSMGMIGSHFPFCLVQSGRSFGKPDKLLCLLYLPNHMACIPHHTSETPFQCTSDFEKNKLPVAELLPHG